MSHDSLFILFQLRYAGLCFSYVRFFAPVFLYRFPLACDQYLDWNYDFLLHLVFNFNFKLVFECSQFITELLIASPSLNVSAWSIFSAASLSCSLWLCSTASIVLFGSSFWYFYGLGIHPSPALSQLYVELLDLSGFIWPTWASYKLSVSRIRHITATLATFKTRLKTLMFRWAFG